MLFSLFIKARSRMFIVYSVPKDSEQNYKRVFNIFSGEVWNDDPGFGTPGLRTPRPGTSGPRTFDSRTPGPRILRPQDLGPNTCNHALWYFKTFWWLSKFSFHHKWNAAWLLAINWYIRVASRFTEWLKTYDLRKLGKS